jgi:hypothetical protein
MESIHFWKKHNYVTLGTLLSVWFIEKVYLPKVDASGK